MDAAECTAALSDIAHGRSGDKGNHANIAVIAYTPAGYRLAARAPDRRGGRSDYFAPLGPSRVVRYEAPNLLALNFVLYDVLAGGASRSLRTDTQGKTLALALLQMPIDRPDELRRHAAPDLRRRTMSEPLVLYELRPPAAVLTLNRPDRRNALSRGLIAALTDAFARARDDAAARCVILTGAGTVFCAGMDLAELQESLDQPAARSAGLGRRPAPGAAVRPDLHAAQADHRRGQRRGGGRRRRAGDGVRPGRGVPEARFGYPEVRRGLVAAMVMPHLLRHVGERTGPLPAADRRADRRRGGPPRRAGQRGGAGRAAAGKALAWARSLAEGGPQRPGADQGPAARVLAPGAVGRGGGARPAPPRG